MGEPRPVGPGRVLTLAYGFFALAAGARSTVQLISHPHRAPTAYVLSAVAAAIYLVGTVLVSRAEQGRLRRLAVAGCLVELAGVLGVGVLSLVRPELFPEASVWSRFGSGYGYVPALLPVAALVWLRPVLRARSETTPTPTAVASAIAPSTASRDDA